MVLLGNFRSSKFSVFSVLTISIASLTTWPLLIRLSLSHCVLDCKVLRAEDTPTQPKCGHTWHQIFRNPWNTKYKKPLLTKKFIAKPKCDISTNSDLTMFRSKHGHSHSQFFPSEISTTHSAHLNVFLSLTHATCSAPHSPQYISSSHACRSWNPHCVCVCVFAPCDFVRTCQLAQRRCCGQTDRHAKC